MRILSDYIFHLEAKFEGDVGVLQRKQIEVTDIVHIGKESNNLSIDEELDDESYQIYEDPSKLDTEFSKIADKVLKLKPKDVKSLGITKPTLWRAQRKIESNQINRISDRIKNLFVDFFAVESNQSEINRDVHIIVVAAVSVTSAEINFSSFGVNEQIVQV